MEGDLELTFRKNLPDGGEGRVFASVCLVFLLACAPVLSQELREPPVVKESFCDRHPILTKPATLSKKGLKAVSKKVWDTCVAIGEKAKPILPFLELCGAAGSVAAPFVYGFTKGG